MHTHYYCIIHLYKPAINNFTYIHLVDQFYALHIQTENLLEKREKTLNLKNQVCLVNIQVIEKSDLKQPGIA